MKTIKTFTLALCFFVALSGLSLQVNAADYSWKARVDAKLLIQLPEVKQFSATKSGEVPVSIRLSSPLTNKVMNELMAAGFKPLKTDGKWLFIGSIISGATRLADLEKLAGIKNVERIEFAISRIERPMDVARVSNGIDQAYENYVDDNGKAITGEGVTICIDDSRVDIFHPAFFRPDGGDFNWLDVNDNNSFDAGFDAVDINNNGSADAGETLNFFDANINRDYYAPVENDDGVFQADIDYLYNDTDDSGEREFGPAEGFTEDSPCYGEQVFFVNDSNGNNTLDEGEILTGLSSSKVKIASVYDGSKVVSYTRGTDLINYPFAESSYISHGTGTAGISASGWDPHRFRGVAYNAELVLVESAIAYYTAGQYEIDGINMAADLALCKEGGAQITLHEYCITSSHVHDGSSNDAAAITAAENDGLLPICPTCNYKNGKKATRFRVAPKSYVEKTIDTEPTYPQYGDYSYLSLNLDWRQPDRDVVIELKMPDGTWNGLEGDWGWLEQDKVVWYKIFYQSDRGTSHYNLIIYSGDGHSTISEPFHLRVHNNGATPLDVSGFCSDEQSAFAYGLVWMEDAADGNEENENLTTTSLPAGADGGTGIGAHSHLDGQTGLADYSSGGLRIDGAMTVHVTGTYAQMTPGAHFTPSQAVFESYEHGNFVMFGGTSSSSPLMAGITALVKQYRPDIDGPGLRKAIMLSSDNSLAQSNPDIYWGWGKVSVPDLLDATENCMTDETEPQPTIFSDKVGVAGESMVFSAAGTLDDRKIVEWEWSSSDGATGENQMWFIHKFEDRGDYTVSLTVTDEGGNSVTVTKNINIVLSINPYSPEFPRSAEGPCNLWQPSRCDDGFAVNCLEGTWDAVKCETYCQESGYMESSCNIAESGSAECQCEEAQPDGDEIADGDESTDGDNEIADGDEASEDGDDDTQTVDGDDPEDGNNDENDGSGGSGCNGTNNSAGILSGLLISLAAISRIRRKLE